MQLEYKGQLSDPVAGKGSGKIFKDFKMFHWKIEGMVSFVVRKLAGRLEGLAEAESGSSLDSASKRASWGQQGMHVRFLSTGMT